jgi:septal ring factor EnvC (AmiA/AmiB activator)
MLRRSPRSTTPLRRRQQELARQESELRERVEKLERSIAAAPQVAEERARRQREEFLMRANSRGSRLDVSIALQDKRYSDDSGSPRHRGSLRKERRDGRIIFLVLAIALAVAVIWLVSHLHL